MKMLVAKDTIHVSAVRSEPFTAGEPFEIDEAIAQVLIERGLAVPAKAHPRKRKAEGR